MSGRPSSATEATAGFPKLAGFLGLKPEIAIFKRFAKLNAENLLLLQSELMILEHQLNEIVAQDLRSENSEVKYYARSWWNMLRPTRNGDRNQLRKRLEIREKLREYSTTSSTTFTNFASLKMVLIYFRCRSSPIGPPSPNRHPESIRHRPCP